MGTATKASRSFVKAPTTDGYLVWGPKQDYERLSFGNNWGDIQLGVMFSYTPNGTANLVGVRTGLGLCSGSTNGIGSAITNHFVGGIGGARDAAFTPRNHGFNANGTLPTYSFYDGSNFNQCVAGRNSADGTSLHSVGTTGSAQAFYQPTNTGSLQRRGIWIVRLTRTAATTVLVKMFAPSNAQAQLDWSELEFETAVKTDGTPQLSASPMALHTAAGNSVTIDEATYGDLDTFNFWWSDLNFPVDFYKKAFWRFST